MLSPSYFLIIFLFQAFLNIYFNFLFLRHYFKPIIMCNSSKIFYIVFLCCFLRFSYSTDLVAFLLSLAFFICRFSILRLVIKFIQFPSCMDNLISSHLKPKISFYIYLAKLQQYPL